MALTLRNKNMAIVIIHPKQSTTDAVDADNVPLFQAILSSSNGWLALISTIMYLLQKLSAIDDTNFANLGTAPLK